MTAVAEMLRTYPKDLGGVDQVKLSACIEACLDCSQTCTACADACLSEDMVAELTKCIRTCTDCSDVCDTTYRVLSRHTGYDANISRGLLEACAAACLSCASECSMHADVYEHCRICSDACSQCEIACRELLASMR